MMLVSFLLIFGILVILFLFVFFRFCNFFIYLIRDWCCLVLILGIDLRVLVVFIFCWWLWWLEMVNWWDLLWICWIKCSVGWFVFIGMVLWVFVRINVFRLGLCVVFLVILINNGFLLWGYFLKNCLVWDNCFFFLLINRILGIFLVFCIFL